MSDKKKDDVAYSEKPKSGNSGPSFETELNSEKPKAGSEKGVDVSKSEKPKW
jgi:hypothetical protein